MPLSTTQQFSQLHSGHLSAITTLEQQCFASFAWSEAIINSQLKQADRLTFGLLAGDTLHGYAALSLLGPTAELLRLAIAPNTQRQGLGKQLLQASIQAVTAQGATTIQLEVASDNQAAIALYRMTGFTVDGTRPNYYADAHGNLQDGILMSQTLVL